MPLGKHPSVASSERPRRSSLKRAKQESREGRVDRICGGEVDGRTVCVGTVVFEVDVEEDWLVDDDWIVVVVD